MTAKILLTLFLLSISIYTFTQKSRIRHTLFFIELLIALGIFFVWAPDATTTLANAIGIGRGADLVFYFAILFLVFFIFNLHLKLRIQHEEITELARRVAIISAHARRTQNDENKNR